MGPASSEAHSGIPFGLGWFLLLLSTSVYVCMYVSSGSDCVLVFYIHFNFNVMQNSNCLTIIDAMETNSGLYSCQYNSDGDAVVVTDIQVSITR